MAVHSITELAGTSTESFDSAIRDAIKTASKSLRNLEWFEVTDVRGRIINSDIAEFQVVLKVGIKYES